MRIQSLWDKIRVQRETVAQRDEILVSLWLTGPNRRLTLKAVQGIIRRFSLS
ncbi:DUF2575 domain-containing protein [Cronobacter muytjensii]|uniref:DUF2575 domain-containing protein n=1 Tax=Cronobacter muytjensii TaxID=413501 RepID=A0ABQ6U2Q6_9ENTR|nr:DUF2575 domain-containing protein [Cronobacter muytjensii]KAB0884480.1 DUF2575 domain-containing protein [Cronobacter muytjensii]NCH56001.1 DUF2575 domain-containing protein [Cronobacter muytjensii]NCI17790.1 DUF2575 domain-containing protein [Cronobacter muytjensii]NUW59846.1 DUF2575 family protein [Cronobacter muytjensii]